MTTTSNDIGTAAPASEGARAILAAAEQLFAAKGYDAVSISEIAQRAGVSKANIFHHFSSKHELYLAVLRQACSEANQLLQAAASDRAPLGQRLRAFAANHLTSMLEHDRASRLVLREILEDGSQRVSDLVEQVFSGNFAQLVEVIRAGQKQGELRKDIDPAMLTTLLVGANVFFFETHGVLRHSPAVDFADDPARYSAMLWNILWRGVCADSDGNEDNRN